MLNAFSIDEVRPDISSLWENWVIAEVAKRNALFGSLAELYFWRTRSHSEVDLVIKNMMEQLGVNALRAFGTCERTYGVFPLGQRIGSAFPGHERGRREMHHESTLAV